MRGFGISGAEYLFDEDFGMYPETAQDVWTEDSANQAIGNILLAVKRMKYRSAEDAITLRKCGETLEQKDPELARWLLDLADGYGQNGNVTAKYAVASGLLCACRFLRLHTWTARSYDS